MYSSILFIAILSALNCLSSHGKEGQNLRAGGNQRDRKLFFDFGGDSGDGDGDSDGDGDLELPPLPRLGPISGENLPDLLPSDMDGDIPDILGLNDPLPDSPLLDQFFGQEDICAGLSILDCVEKLYEVRPGPPCGPRRGICYFLSDSDCEQLFNRTRGPCDDDEDSELCLLLGSEGPCADLTSEECLEQFHFNKGACAEDENSDECILRRDRREHRFCRGPCYLLNNEECRGLFDRDRGACDEDEDSEECEEEGRGNCGVLDPICEIYMNRRRGPCYLLTNDECLLIFNRTKNPCDDDEESADCLNFGHVKGPCYYLTDEECMDKFGRPKDPCDFDEYSEDCMIFRRRGPCKDLSLIECLDQLTPMIDQTLPPPLGLGPRPGFGFGIEIDLGDLGTFGGLGGGFSRGNDSEGDGDVDEEGAPAEEATYDEEGSGEEGESEEGEEGEDGEGAVDEDEDAQQEEDS